MPTREVILLARGASDMVSTGEVAKMAHWLYETTQHELILPAFTGICFPRLEQVVQRLDALGASQIIVLLARHGRLDEAVLIEKTGTPEERIVPDLASLRGVRVGYLSLVLVRRTAPAV
jgi:sirohydrochlorin ferrochelatase